MAINLFERVYKVVKTIPKGKVVSYGQIAAKVGNPRAARQVGWALHLLDNAKTDVPWWRVINNEGRISIRGNFEATSHLQKQLLMAEKVEIDENLHLDMKKFRWHFPT